ncbi:MAG TPA: hypothetical protein VMU86_02855, partial [Steroidobacteraceae bacterium]|nr:hypothetical protein [Steroidobacteraceae bacterium]
MTSAANPPSSEPPAAPPHRAAHWAARLRRLVRVATHAAWTEYLPVALAALLAAVSGALAMRPDFAPLLAALIDLGRSGATRSLRLTDLAELPRVIVGLALVLMSFGLLLRARIAWVIALLLAALVAALSWRFAHASQPALWAAAALIVVLLIYARRFDRSNLAASTLFALL